MADAIPYTREIPDSIRRLLDGPDHDEIMRKVALAKEARNYGARLRGTEPNDCPAVHPLHLSSPHTCGLSLRPALS